MYLCATFEEEPVRIHTIFYSVTNNWKPVKDDRRFIRVLEQDLLQNIQHHHQDDGCDEASSAHRESPSLGNLLAQWAGNQFENTHLADNATERDKVQGKREGMEVECRWWIQELSVAVVLLNFDGTSAGR